MSTVTSVLQSLAPQSWYSTHSAGSALADDKLKQSQTDTPKKTLGESLRPLITSFVENDLEYKPRPPRDNRALWKAADEYAIETGVPREDGSRSAKIFQTGVMYAACCVPRHPVEVQVYVAMYSWLGLLLDDSAAEHEDEFARFGARFISGERHPLPLLQAWADLMRLTYTYWDPAPANFIVTASLNFLNSNLLQTGAAFRGIAATAAANGSSGHSNNSGRSWARYVREKDGGGDAVAYFTFPKSMYPNQEEYLECIPDLARYINLANDILSFYKEERAGENDNFISQMAMYEDKEKVAVVEDLIDDVAKAVERIRATIQGKGPYAAAVEDHILGYVAFHKLSPRYRLSEVGLGEESFKVVS
ncbi:hypothetical protein PG999_010850 [Apiospora kogelbergensis]|uniref:Terpene synthase n=2 Tax=Apiospora kogelbergensis TaxID=1337665 RepID=A0AAW0QM42_9PEZI